MRVLVLKYVSFWIISIYRFRNKRFYLINYAFFYGEPKFLTATFENYFEMRNTSRQEF